MSGWQIIDETDEPELVKRVESTIKELGSSASELHALVPKALQVLGEQLATIADPSDEEYIALQKLRQTAAEVILRTAAKVDENVLRQKQVDMLPKFLELLAREKAERAALTGNWRA